MMRAIQRALLAAAIVTTGLSAHTRAARAAETFDKPMSLYIGSGPGGGYDLYGRLVARHLGKHLPGEPAITARNMPGAGSVAVSNFIFSVAPKDGTALAIASPSLALIEALETPGVRFETAKLNWIGRVASITNVTLVSADAPATTAAEAKKTPVLIGAISANSPLTQLPKALSEHAGTKFKMVPGYADSNATLLAVERGEVHGSTVSWGTLKTQKPDWLSNDRIRILVQYTQTRHPDLPDVPTALELASSDQDRGILGVYVSGAAVGYSIFAPPGVAATRVAALRQGFADMLDDREFRDDVKKLGLDFDPESGAFLQKLIADYSRSFPAIRARVTSAAR